MKKRTLSILLCLVMIVGLLPTAVFAVDEEAVETVFSYQYEAQNGETVTKISHPQVAPNANGTNQRTNDGVVDYAGNGVITGSIGTDADSGARGESYSWSALGHGDWVYTCLLYDAMGGTIDQIQGGLGYEFDRETMNAALNVLYNGDFFLGEDDGGNPGGALVKINVKTGEVEVLMSESVENEAYRHSVFFRNAVEYNGKFYFCGSVDHAPQIWQVDPETDACQMVYGMSVQDFYAAYQQGISAGIRGLCVYNGELIISCVMKNEKNGKIEPQICSTKDPEHGFTVIATQEDLFDYPAYHFTDSIYGGSIWEIVAFNGKLYVSICTGTPDNMPDETTMQSFAIVRGEKQSDGSWTWSPVVGDRKDGAKYPFGIDPERTCSGAGVLAVYDDHLYIAEYNDEEIALINAIFNLDLEFMNKNLEQSVNLYRMDADETIELVVGDETEKFPARGMSGLGSGFGHHENQYIWRMTVHNGKLYCGTFDTSSLLEPIGQFSNGNLESWTPDQWSQLFAYMRELLKLTQGSGSNGGKLDHAFSAAETREDIRDLFALFTELGAPSTPFAIDGKGHPVDTAEDAGLTVLAHLFSDLPKEFFEEYENDALEDAISNELAAAFDGDLGTGAVTFEEDGVDAGGPDENGTVDNWDEVVNFMKELVQIAKKVVVTAQYMKNADRGCDIYVSENGIAFETVTTDGFGDPFNHGLRVYAEAEDGLAFGTANPFYGTQWWYIEDAVNPTYTVRFDANGGSGSMAAETGVLGSYTLPACTFTAPAGKQFKGWATGAADEIITGAAIQVTKDTTLYAIWEDIPAAAEEYTITFDGNGGTPSVNRMQTTGKKLESLPTADRSGSYRFDGWYTAKTGGVKITTSYEFSGDTEVCAHWIDTGSSSSGSGSRAYSVTVKNSANGTVAANRKTASFGATVTLTVSPEPNWVLDTLTATSARGKVLDLSVVQAGETYTFRMPSSSVTVTATFTEKNHFVDVPADSYYYDAVLWAVDKGITQGADSSHFSPNSVCTRAQAVTFLWRAAGSPAPKSGIMPFTDVPSGAYYYDAVLWAVENGVTKGTADTAFSPDAACTRAQIMTFLWHSQKSPASGGANPFTDVAADAYYAGAVLWAAGEGVTSGTTAATFGPEDPCTRAQIVTFIWRAMK